MCQPYVMEKTNALKLRQNLGAVIRKLKTIGKPILVEKGREPVAVLISLEDYKKRFVDQTADELRTQIVQEIKGIKLKLPSHIKSVDLVRELRN